MKKAIFILISFLTFGLIAEAQTAPYFQVGVGVSKAKFIQEAEVGVIKNSHQFAVVGETYEGRYEREWYAGVKYAKNFNSGLQASGAAKLHLNEGTYDLVFEPGLAYNINLTPGVSLQPQISTPISEGQRLFSPFGLKAGVGLQVRL